MPKNQNAKTDETAAADEVTAIISVRSPTGPFRRGGIQFGLTAIELNTAELTEAQLEAITNEPLLAVEWFTPTAADAERKPETGAGE